MVRKKIILGIGAILLFSCIWFDQTRNIYCLDNGQCVTVWKRIGGTCYVIPRKYKGIFVPMDNYIKTNNSVFSFGIIWISSKKILVGTDPNDPNGDIVIKNKNTRNINIENYKTNKQHNDSIFTYFDGEYHRYKSNVEYLSIDIYENFATNNLGENLNNKK